MFKLKMGGIFGVIFLLGCAVISVSCEEDQTEGSFTPINGMLTWWNQDVYTGRQWNEYMTPTKVATSVVNKPGVLLLYSPECLEEVTKTNLADWTRPAQQYFCFAKHDCVSSPQHIWYTLDEKDRLCERYNFEKLKCGSYLFFQNGSDINEPTEVFHPENNDMDVGDWMWSIVSMTLTVENKLSTAVDVEVQCRGPRIPKTTLEPDDTVTLDVFLSCIVTIERKDNRKFVFGKVLEETKPVTVTVNDDTTMGDDVKSRKWFKLRDNEVQEEAQNVRRWRWAIAEIYLMDFKHPPLLPKFTEQGYKKGRMPDEMYSRIIEWYRSNGDKRIPEQNDVEPAINDREVKCAMVNLDEDLKKYIGDVMKPYLEDWVNMTLDMTHLYGIREYFRGNILRNHVDRATTHVISVILQIDQELDGAPDWELEIIDFTGSRRNVTLLPGEMLFYESATLIHGRPFPFQGKRFANAFLHYKPVENWTWKTKDNYLSRDGQRVERIDNFASANTYRGSIPKRDEL